MNVGQTTGPAPRPSQAAEPEQISDEGAINRLRASRKTFRQNLELDAKKAGTRWLMTHATYEQVMFLLALKASGGKDEMLLLENAATLLEDIEKSFDIVSGIAGWARDEFWLDAFIGAALGRWKDLAASVEGADKPA